VHHASESKREHHPSELREKKHIKRQTNGVSTDRNQQEIPQWPEMAVNKDAHRVALHTAYQDSAVSAAYPRSPPCSCRQAHAVKS
jgi:hypothetical protein